MFVQFLRCEVILSILYSLGGNQCAHPWLRSRESYSISFGMNYPYHLFAILPYRIFFFFSPHLFIHSLIYRLIHIYFILLVINLIPYYLFCCVNIPVLAIGSSLSWFLYFFDIPHLLCGGLLLFCFVFWYFPTFQYYKILQAHSIYLLPQF